MKYAPRPPRGLTLVELMIAIALGLYLSAITAAVFVNSRVLFKVGSAQSRMAENTRLAMEVLKNELRHGGFQGCHSPWTTWNSTLLDAANQGFLDTAPGVSGYAAAGGAWSPSLPSLISAQNPAPVVGSDVLSIRVPVDLLSLGMSNNLPDALSAPAVDAGSNPNIKMGAIALISNCQVSALFAITNISGSGALSHLPGGANGLSNVSADLGFPFKRDNTALYILQTNHYFIAPSLLHPQVQASDAPTNSLWRYSSPDGHATEIATGIDAIHLLYAVDTDDPPDAAANRYVTADKVTDWSTVVAIKINLDVSTTQTGVSLSDKDTRLHQSVSQVFSLRNRTP